MDTEECIGLIKKSVQAWNEWREKNPLAIPELAQADLSSTNLKDINLKKGILSKVNFRNAYLRGANFESANLEKAVFRMADLASANLRFANLYKANFRRADLWRADLGFANLRLANLGRAIMQQINLEGANLEGAILSDADLKGANLRSANLREADLTGANLEGADLTEAQLDNAKLENAILKDAITDKAPAGSPESIGRKKGEITSGSKEVSRQKTAAVESYPPGTKFGPYEIIEKIAKGGMGIVYLAFDKSLEREVAIKILSSDLKENPEYLQRFLQEARITAQMDHPNIINIYSISREQGEFYVAMQYIKGKTVSRLLKEKRSFDCYEALSIIRCVASALACAHKQGLIHRDIKPDNIMIDESGRVRVMDFGIARDLSLEKRITQDGHFMGTIHYSAPEQWSTDVPDPRSDIYSLGIVFYEMLTGKIPFDADSPMNLLYKITRERPTPIRELRPETPVEIVSIVNKMIAKDLHERYYSAEQIVQDIDEVLEKKGMGEHQEDELLSLAELNTLLREKISSEDFINTPTNLLLMLEDMEFSAKNKKKFLKFMGDEIFTRKLGSGWFYVLFQETLMHNLEKGRFPELFPLLSSAKKGKSLTEEEVVELIDELAQVEKTLQALPLTKIWTLSIDMKTKGTVPINVQGDELQKILSEYSREKNPSDFSNLRDFFEPILTSYHEVCMKAVENKCGAYWS